MNIGTAGQLGQVDHIEGSIDPPMYRGSLHRWRLEGGKKAKLP